MKFYMHAGSLNHGCEAIVRSTVNMINDQVTIYSEHPEEDRAVGLDSICTVKHQGHARNKKDIGFIVTKGIETVFHTDAKFDYLYSNLLNEAKAGELFVSIGGDNYCYGNNPNLFFLNRKLNEKGCKTILWGCSIEPKTLADPALIRDLNRYTTIFARESITYQALIDSGISKEKMRLFPDPAFSLPDQECALPKAMLEKDSVGINLSPLVNTLDETGGNVFENYKQAVKYLLDETDWNVVFIPHVCKPGNDDRTILRRLKKEFPDNSRIVMVNEEAAQNCKELKYIISKCRFMITARTHASIAAYSRCVPTLVVGYSVKAKGIAKDIFGTYEGMVVDISEMKAPKVLREKVMDLIRNEQAIHDTLEKNMPGFIQKSFEAGQLLKNG